MSGIFDSHAERKAKESIKRPEISPLLHKQIEDFVRDRIPQGAGDSSWTHQRFIENAATQKTVDLIIEIVRPKEESHG